MDKYEEGIWYRQGDLLFTLKHAGWHKGEPLMSNHFTIRVDRGKGAANEEYEKLISSVHNFLTAQSTNKSEDR